MVFGESTRPRNQVRSTRKWYLGNEAVEEADEVHHLRILRSVSFSTISCTIERAQLGEVHFLHLTQWDLDLDACTQLHPIESIIIIGGVCLPIMLYGSELWSLANTN